MPLFLVMENANETPYLVAVLSLLVNIVLVAFVYLQKRLSDRLITLDERTLGLSAYNLAVRQLLDFKDSFPGDLFEAEMQRGQFSVYVPSSMKPRDFLTFARGMWAFSFVFSVFSRNDLDLRSEEREALKQEIALWLKLPGFREVWEAHTLTLNVHNAQFVKWIETEVYRAETGASGWGEWRGGTARE